ncbi:branched-chain amino acid aminotransferase [SAR202 cluster bacterium AD-804-J14_MRT_500m]|nr:branched-chain amino acid aminotransferase [SAR202 cluster bacterium AD-804-J14_MRT_500m]
MLERERVVYLNGEILAESQAKISFRDLGFLHGDAVFDTTRTFNGKIFKLQEHIDRLFKSLKYMRIDPGLTKETFSTVTTQVVEQNLKVLDRGDDYWVSQRITRGVRGTGLPLKPTVLIECTPLPLADRAHYFRDGLPVVVPSVRRTPPEAMSPRAKVHNYVNLELAELEVKAQNPDAWAILLDMRGNIAEGPGSNFFMVKDNVVITPKEQYILGGISRQTAMELAQELDIEVLEADIDLYDVYTADEAFVTSTSFCICPVSSINGSKMGEEVPGPVTDRLQKAYSGLVGMDFVDQYLAHQ